MKVLTCYNIEAILTASTFSDFLASLTSAIKSQESSTSNPDNQPPRKYFLPKTLPWRNSNLAIFSQLFNVLALSEPQCDLILLAVSTVPQFAIKMKLSSRFPNAILRSEFPCLSKRFERKRLASWRLPKCASLRLTTSSDQSTMESK